MAADLVPSPDYVLRGHESAVNCISFCGTGSILSGSVDGDVKLWNLSSRRATTRSTAHIHSIISVQPLISSSSSSGDSAGNQAASFITAGRDECVKLWDMSTFSSSCEPTCVLHTGAKHFCNIAVSVKSGSDTGASAPTGTDGSCIVVTPSSIENRALVWDIRARSVVHVVDTPVTRGMITGLHVDTSSSSSSSSSFATHACSTLLIGLEDGSLVTTDLRYTKEHIAMTVAAGSATVNHGIEDIEHIYETDIPGLPPQPQQHYFLDLQDKQPLMAMAVSQDGKHIITGGADHSLHLVSRRKCTSSDAATAITSTDTDTGTNVSEAFTHILSSTVTLPAVGTSSIQIRNDGRIAVSGHWDSTIRIYQLKNNKSLLRPLAVLTHHRESVFGVAFSPNPNGGIFATCSKDTTIAVWSVYANDMKCTKTKNTAHTQHTTEDTQDRDRDREYQDGEHKKA